MSLTDGQTNGQTGGRRRQSDGKSPTRHRQLAKKNSKCVYIKSKYVSIRFLNLKILKPWQNDMVLFPLSSHFFPGLLSNSILQSCHLIFSLTVCSTDSVIIRLCPKDYTSTLNGPPFFQIYKPIRLHLCRFPATGLSLFCSLIKRATRVFLQVLG